MLPNLTVHFPGNNSNVQAVLTTLTNAQLIDSFHTTLAFSPNDPLLRFLPASLNQSLLRRSFSMIGSTPLHRHPWLELSKLICSALHLRSITNLDDSPLSPYQIGRALDRDVANYLLHEAKNRRISGVYCYEDSALNTFRAAKKLGIKCIYDLPTPFFDFKRKIMEEEFERRPAWRMTMGRINYAQKAEAKNAELEMADLVVCPSNFVWATIPDRMKTAKRHVIAEYGTPKTGTDLASLRRQSVEGKLRLLFVGYLSQYKGVADLFDAMKLLNRNDVELVVLGKLLAPMDFYRAQYPDFVYLPPTNPAGVLEAMKSCDVFVFPSLFEGRGLVQLEAMSCGMPLITTKNATGEDLVTDGWNGFVVPVCDAVQLAERIAWFAENRDLIPEMGARSAERAGNWTWESYGKTILDGIFQLFSEGCPENQDNGGCACK